MRLPASLINPVRLSPAVQKALAPGPALMMVARGMMPLPPGDLTVALYQLAVGDDPTLAAAASATATSLPERVLAAALTDTTSDPRVLDWLAERIAGKPALVDALASNRNTADETVAALASVGTADDVDRIATNEQRLLRHPEIIGAMYLNPRARMSTVDRAIELAVRNQIRVPGLAAWDEIAKAIGGGVGAAANAAATDDAMFARAASRATEADSPGAPADAELELPAGEGDAAADAVPEDKDLPVGRMTVPMKMRLAAMGNAFARSMLVRDPLKLVAMAAIKSPGVNDTEVRKYAGNAGLCEDVIRYIAQRGDWTKNYNIKLALILNPKNSLADSMRQLPFMKDKELKTILRSKNIPSALVQQAKKIQQQRSGGVKK